MTGASGPDGRQCESGVRWHVLVLVPEGRSQRRLRSRLKYFFVSAPEFTELIVPTVVTLPEPRPKSAGFEERSLLLRAQGNEQRVARLADASAVGLDQKFDLQVARFAVAMRRLRGSPHSNPFQAAKGGSCGWDACS